MLLNFLWFGLILLSVLADLCSGQPFSSSQANLTTFQYYDDGIGMANNYWSSFFNMISKNIDNLRKIKKETDDILYSMYSA